MTSPLRVAAVSYLNSVPLVWGLVHGPYKDRFHVDYMVPSRCSDALRDGQADAGIIPSIEYQRIEDLQVVPRLCVASPGPVRSVLLISTKPLKDIDSIAVDTASRTSACLLNILLARRYRIAPRLTPHAPDLAAMLRQADAALVIGDPALASDFPGLQVYDLADEWREMTGLPFVFAIWAVRRDASSPDLIEAFQQSAAYSLARLDEITREEAARTGLTPAFVRSYLTENIHFDLDRKNLEGLERFYALAHELGFTDSAKPVDFIN